MSCGCHQQVDPIAKCSIRRLSIAGNATKCRCSDHALLIYNAERVPNTAIRVGPTATYTVGWNDACRRQAYVISRTCQYTRSMQHDQIDRCELHFGRNWLIMRNANVAASIRSRSLSTIDLFSCHADRYAERIWEYRRCISIGRWSDLCVGVAARCCAVS